VRRIESEGAAVGVARLPGRSGLELAGPLVPVVGRELGAVLLRLAKRAAHHRRDLPRELGHAEVEEDLPRLGLPPPRALLDHDAAALDGDAGRRQRPALRHLLAQTRQGRSDPAGTRARLGEASGGAQEDEVLKREPHPAACSALGRQESRAHVSPDLRLRDGKELRDFRGGVALHKLES